MKKPTKPNEEGNETTDPVDVVVLEKAKSGAQKDFNAVFRHYRMHEINLDIDLLEKRKKGSRKLRTYAVKYFEWVNLDQAGAQAPRKKVIKPPGYRLDAIIRFFWRGKTYARVFEALRAELLHEWHEAEVAGDHRKVALIRYVHTPWAMLSHVVRQIAGSGLRRLLSLVRAAF